MNKFILLCLSSIYCFGCTGSIYGEKIEVAAKNEPIIENEQHKNVVRDKDQAGRDAVNTETQYSIENTLHSAEIDLDTKDCSENNQSVKKGGWFVPSHSVDWYQQLIEYADTTYLESFFKAKNYDVPSNTYALIAPIQIQDGQLRMKYYSYRKTAFIYSMKETGEENFWPASTVKLTAAVLALLKLREYEVGINSVVTLTDIEGDYHDTVERLCRHAIIPSKNAAYNRLMEIAGLDEINDHFLPNVFHFPTMVLQRRYARHHPEDNLRESPKIDFRDGEKSGTIDARRSDGRIRTECPNEGNCSTLAELAEVMFRVVMHDKLTAERRFNLYDSDIVVLKEILKKAPSCIGKGVSAVMGKDAIIYNKGGKVTGDDRLEVAIVESADGKERYLIALSVPHYDGVEQETNLLARWLIEGMRDEK